MFPTAAQREAQRKGAMQTRDEMKLGSGPPRWLGVAFLGEQGDGRRGGIGAAEHEGAKQGDEDGRAIV